MKRYLLTVFIALGLTVALCSCNAHTDVGDHTDAGEHTDEGKYISLSDTLSEDFYMKTEYPEYDADVEKIALIFGRKNGRSFKYDHLYVVYVYEDDEWKKIPFVSSHTYILSEYEVTKKDPTAPWDLKASHTISVADLNVKLKPGRYRVQKEFKDGSAYAEFVIK